MNRLLSVVFSLVLPLSIMVPVFLFPAAAQAAAEPVRLRATVVYVASLDEYCLRAGPGEKYHPVRPLPQAFRSDGLEILADVRLRPDIMGSGMYGTAVEILSIHKASDYVSPEERTARRVLLLRLQAFNSRDLTALRRVDAPAAGLTQEQFDAWLSGYGNFRLRYLEASPVKGSDRELTGMCIYSRERLGSLALSGSATTLALMEFTMAKTGDGWKITATGPYRPGPGLDVDRLVADLLAKAEQKYGTTDLAEWKGSD